MRALAVLAALSAGPATAQQITGATFADPTTRYDHGILGDAVEWGDLQIDTTAGAYRLPLPRSQVYEDTTPRLWDVTGDGAPEVVVIHTDVDLGARLLIIGIVEGRPAALAATPHIGQTHRWLAPVGAADLDGDGRVEIALVDRPHLAKNLQLWRVEGDALRKVASHAGLTVHRIGDPDIAGGLTCDGRGIVTLSADWSRIVVSTFDGTALTATDAGPHTPKALSDLLTCG